MFHHTNFSYYFLGLLILFVALQAPALAIKKSYIVYLGEHNHGPDVTSVDFERVRNSHTQLLSSFLGSEQKAKDSIFYSYKRNINGFAAVLDEDQAAQIAKHPDVISVLLNKGRELHTTHSWDFLRLEKNGVVHPSSLSEKDRYGQGTIIATLDTEARGRGGRGGGGRGGGSRVWSGGVFGGGCCRGGIFGGGCCRGGVFGGGCCRDWRGGGRSHAPHSRSNSSSTVSFTWFHLLIAYICLLLCIL